MPPKKSILLLTDFAYEAKGREYFREDVELSCFLRKFFKTYISHINDAEEILSQVDLVLIRNTGPQISHQRELQRLKSRKDLLIFNDLSGKGDINGKHHLLELFRSGFPVIPTFDSKNEVEKLQTYERYLLKPLNGADSEGVKILSHAELQKDPLHNTLIQPLIDFQHEVSFYFIGTQFYYSLYAPNPQKRWELKTCSPSKEDIEFALKFINWNTCKYGIQRVDACRLKDNTLLLMELEDYNPFLSLDLLEQDVKERFLNGLCASIAEQINKNIPSANQ